MLGSIAEIDFDQMALWEQRSLKGHWAYANEGSVYGIISSVIKIDGTTVVSMYVPRSRDTRLFSAKDITVDWDARRAWSQWLGPVEDPETFNTKK